MIKFFGTATYSVLSLSSESVCAIAQRSSEAKAAQFSSTSIPSILCKLSLVLQSIERIDKMQGISSEQGLVGVDSVLRTAGSHAECELSIVCTKQSSYICLRAG